MTDAPLYFQTHIFCCTNRLPDGHQNGCCATKGGEELRNYMKKRAKEMNIESTRVNGAGCLDRCEFGPVIVIYPEGVWYSPKNEADIDEILAVHVQQGKRVERLLIPSAA